MQPPCQSSGLQSHVDPQRAPAELGRDNSINSDNSDLDLAELSNSAPPQLPGTSQRRLNVAKPRSRPRSASVLTSAAYTDVSAASSSSLYSSSRSTAPPCRRFVELAQQHHALADQCRHSPAPPLSSSASTLKGHILWVHFAAAQASPLRKRLSEPLTHCHASPPRLDLGHAGVVLDGGLDSDKDQRRRRDERPNDGDSSSAEDGFSTALHNRRVDARRDDQGLDRSRSAANSDDATQSAPPSPPPPPKPTAFSTRSKLKLALFPFVRSSSKKHSSPSITTTMGEEHGTSSSASPTRTSPPPSCEPPPTRRRSTFSSALSLDLQSPALTMSSSTSTSSSSESASTEYSACCDDLAPIHTLRRQVSGRPESAPQTPQSGCFAWQATFPYIGSKTRRPLAGLYADLPAASEIHGKDAAASELPHEPQSFIGSETPRSSIDPLATPRRPEAFRHASDPMALGRRDSDYSQPSVDASVATSSASVPPVTSTGSRADPQNQFSGSTRYAGAQAQIFGKPLRSTSLAASISPLTARCPSINPTSAATSATTSPLSSPLNGPSLTHSHLAYIDRIVITYTAGKESTTACKKLVMYLRRLSNPLPMPVSATSTSDSESSSRDEAGNGDEAAGADVISGSLYVATPSSSPPHPPHSHIRAKVLKGWRPDRVTVRTADDGLNRVDVIYVDGRKRAFDPATFTYEMLLGEWWTRVFSSSGRLAAYGVASSET